MLPETTDLMGSEPPRIGGDVPLPGLLRARLVVAIEEALEKLGGDVLGIDDAPEAPKVLPNLVVGDRVGHREGGVEAVQCQIRHLQQLHASAQADHRAATRKSWRV